MYEHLIPEHRIIVEDFITEIRKFKIKLITEQVSLNFSKNFLSYSTNNVINHFQKNYNVALTGSSALKAYGLISREPNDIDLLVTKQSFDLIKKKYDINKYRYGVTKDVIEHAGYIRYKGHTVDIFVVDDDDFRSRRSYKDGIYVDDAIRIMNKKLSLIRSDKDIEDFDTMTSVLSTGNFYTKTSYHTVYSLKDYIKRLIW
jgi:hypothetical protein